MRSATARSTRRGRSASPSSAGATATPPASYAEEVSAGPKPTGPGQDVFSRIVCGVDDTPASREAVRQAARLAPPDGVLQLVSVTSPTAASHPTTGLNLQAQGANALREAARDCPARSELHLLVGEPAGALLSTATRLQATVIAVGTHGSTRLGGILRGSVASSMLHNARCSVLIARPPPDPRSFPARIIVGVDGSSPAARALLVAEAVASEHESALQVVTAKGADVDVEALPDNVAWHADEHDAVAALLDASTDGDLVIVGSRGLRGLRALGSVSERVAHAAAASVLVVRPVGNSTS